MKPVQPVSYLNYLNIICKKTILPHFLSHVYTLKLPSLFVVWLFWTFHSKSHNMKALVILSHSWSPFLPLTYLYGKKWTFVGLYAAFWSIFLRKNSLRLLMQITWPWPPVDSFSHGLIIVRQREKVNIMLLDLCLFIFYSVHANESTWHWL